MNPILRNTLMAATVLAALPVQAAEPGGLRITEAWTRPTPAAGSTAAGYLRIENHGSSDERLVAVRGTLAARLELHQIIDDQGVARMRPLDDGLLIPAGGEARLAPGGAHLMLFELAAPLLPGQRLPLTLEFAHAGTVTISLHVEARAPESREAVKPAAGEHAQH